MGRTLTVVAVSATLFLLALAPVHADTTYRTSPCRVYDDTAFIGIPGQCGKAFRARPRQLFIRAPRKLQYYYSAR